MRDQCHLICHAPGHKKKKFHGDDAITLESQSEVFKRFDFILPRSDDMGHVYISCSVKAKVKAVACEISLLNIFLQD